MKKAVFIVIILLVCHHCFSQEETQQKKPFTYSVGLSYNQIWLQGNCYGTDEYGAVSSSPFNWGVSSFFSIRKNRWAFCFGCSYMSFSRNQKYSETRFFVDKWQDASLASTIGFRFTGERQRISVTPFLGVDLSYLINYEKDETWDFRIKHYNIDQLDARDYHHYTINGSTGSFPLGLALLGGIGVSCPVTKHLEIGLSYYLKFKIINNIRNDGNPHYPDITSPILYHDANIGVSYRIN